MSPAVVTLLVAAPVFTAFGLLIAAVFHGARRADGDAPCLRCAEREVERGRDRYELARAELEAAGALPPLSADDLTDDECDAVLAAIFAHPTRPLVVPERWAS